MKSFFSRRRQRGVAFTLVELLVVIGIIAILAAIVIGGLSSALRFAKRTKANAMANQISTAVQNYYTEYSVYPTFDASGGTPADDYYSGQTLGGGASPGSWPYITYALCGNINPYNATSVPTGINTRNIAYLTPTRSDIDNNGVPIDPFGSGSTATWYYMIIDTDYSGIVGDSSTIKLPDFTKYATNYTGATLPNGTPGGVAVWSPCDQPVGGGTPAKPSPANFWAHTY